MISNPTPKTALHRDNHDCLKAVLASAIMLALTSPSIAIAGNWTLDSRLNLTETYSDNIDLSAQTEDSSLVTEISPRISASRQGARASASVDYQLQGLVYSASDQKNTVNHQLHANSNLELIEKQFFIDIGASFDQLLTSSQAASTGNRINAPDSRADTLSVTIGPRLTKQLTDQISFILSGNYSFINSVGQAADSEGTSVNFQLNSLSNSRKFHWNLRTSSSHNQPDGGTNSQSESINLNFGYRFSAQLDVSINGGYVDNHIDSAANESLQAGTFWGTTIDWLPSPRTQIRANYNSRLQSSTSRGLSITQRLRRSSVNISYTEDLSSVQQELTNNLINAQQPNLPGASPLGTLNNERFISRKLNASYSLQSGKSSYSLGAHRAKRIYISNTDNEEDTGANASWSLTLSGKSTLSLSTNWSQTQIAGTKTSDQHGYTLSMNRTLSPNTSLSFSAGTTKKNSKDKSADFKENNAQVGLTHRF